MTGAQECPVARQHGIRKRLMCLQARLNQLFELLNCNFGNRLARCEVDESSQQTACLSTLCFLLVWNSLFFTLLVGVLVANVALFIEKYAM